MAIFWFKISKKWLLLVSVRFSSPRVKNNHDPTNIPNIFNHQRTRQLHYCHRPYDPTKNIPGVLFFPGVAPFSINGSLPWLGADGETLFFLCVEPFIPASARRRDTCCFFSKECHRPDLCGCFLLSLWGIEEITHLFTSFLIGIIFLVVKTMVSCFLSLQQIFLWSLESRPMNMVCVSVCQKFFYLHRFF